MRSERKGIAAAAAVWLAAFALAGSAARSAGDAAEEKTITAEGIAGVEKGNVGAARDRALDDALRRAVEQAVGTLIESETIVHNYQVISESIYARSAGFVKRYTVVSEGQDGPLYKVSVSAVVGVGDVRNDLESLGLLIQRMSKPRVLVMIPESNIHDQVWWSQWSSSVGTAEAVVIQALRASEFTVLDAGAVKASIDREAALRALEGDDAAAQAVARQGGAEVIVTGVAVSDPGGAVMGGMSSYQGTVNVRAVKADTGEILAVANGTGKAVHVSAVAGGNEALKQAASMAASELISGIGKQWAKEASGSRMIAVSVAGVPADLADDVADAIRGGVRGIVQVIQREIAGGAARYDVDFKGNGETLSRALGGLELEGGRLEVTAATANKVDLRYVAGTR